VPRNLKQAQNLKERIASKRDDIYAAVTWSLDHPGVVPSLDLHDGINIVTCHPQIIQHVNKLYNFVQTPLVFFYDTTYCVGPYFLSMLSCRHPCLKSNKTVLIAGLIHTFTQQMDHEPIFSKMRKLIQHFNSKKTVVVTDREGSIRNAIANECPNLLHVFCWNHLRQVRGV